MPWKRDENNALATNEHGDPVWVDEDGEKAVDYQAIIAALSRACREAAERKNRSRELEARYSALSQIEDFETWYAQAVAAMEVAQELTGKGQSLEEHVLEKVSAATEELRQQLAAAEEGRLRDRQALERRAIEAAFARSQFVRDRLVSPALAADLFAQYFAIDSEGRLICQGLEDAAAPDGTPLGFDEALARLVDRYPGRDFILKGGAGRGSGASAGSAFHSRTSRRLADCRTEDDKINYLNNVGA
ncbi:MAG: hypothetical protein LBV79_08575 [Candidatus Adiutrix sp.]|jgi:hypothetical protein|nr:hypothetical protein [Candidatus Adiutrix sp.]